MSDVIKRTFCVIGDPIGHSLSPCIHNFIYKTLGLPYKYEAVRVTSDRLRDFVEDSKTAQRPGFNVTLPHKQAVMPFLDGQDGTAERVGAVNTVRPIGGLWIGYNTDVHGCRTALLRAGWKKREESIVLLGAGGAARAAVEALASLGVQKLSLYEIARPRAERMKSDLESKLGIEIVILESEGALESGLRNSGCILNATPVGMWPNVDRSPVPNPEWIPETALVFDMVPNPVETMLIRQAGSRGARTQVGLSMLVAQAIAADEIWLGRGLPETLQDDAFAHCMKEMEAHGTASDSHGR
jgi:shikimate dehydrogenase